MTVLTLMKRQEWRTESWFYSENQNLHGELAFTSSQRQYYNVRKAYDVKFAWRTSNEMQIFVHHDQTKS